MAEYIYYLEEDYGGPFLIDQSQFNELEEVLEAQWKKILQRHESEYDADVNAHVERRIESEAEVFKTKAWSKEAKDAHLKELNSEQSRRKIADELRAINPISDNLHRSVSVGCPGGRTLRGETIAEIDQQLKLDRLTATNISIYLGRGHRDISVSMKITGGGDSCISVEVTPSDEDICREIFMALKLWAESVKPDIRLRAWKNPVAKTVAFAAVALIVFGSLIVLAKSFAISKGFDTDTLVQNMWQQQITRAGFTTEFVLNR